MSEEIPTPEETVPVNSSPEQPPSSRKFNMLTIIFMVTTLICAVGWYSAYKPNVDTEGYRNFESEWGMNGTVSTQRWKANGNRAFVWLDLNYDLNFEKSSAFNFSDDRIYEGYDDNEDGYTERSSSYAPSGKLLQEWYDLDANGCAERLVVYEEAIKVEYKDFNFDCNFDSIRVYSGNQLINSMKYEQLLSFFAQRETDTALVKK